MPDILEQLELLRATESRVAMATLVGARGGSPRPLGAKLFVGEGGRLVGSVSIGGCVDAPVAAYEEATRISRSGRTAFVVTTFEPKPRRMVHPDSYASASDKEFV